MGAIPPNDASIELTRGCVIVQALGSEPKRNGKSCRLRCVAPTFSFCLRLPLGSRGKLLSDTTRSHRWFNQLDPNLNKRPFTEQEEDVVRSPTPRLVP